MDQSQCRAPGKVALISGHKLKLVAVLMFAASAAGYVMLESTPLQIAALGDKLADCLEVSSAAGSTAAACRKEVAAEPTTQVAAITTATTSAATATEANTGSNESPAAGTRAWHATLTNKSGLQPGYTMVEICAASADKDSYNCRADSYREISAASKTGDSATSATYSISGQVLTAAGRGLEGVRVVAVPEPVKDNHAEASVLRFVTVTDSLGNYALTGLPDGDYSIRSSRYEQYQPARIEARAGVNYADLIVKKPASTIIEGQVLSSTGETLEGVTVLPLLLGQPSGLTGNNGRFELSVSLQATVNSFALRFQRPGYHEQSTKVSVRQPGKTKHAAVNVVLHPVESWTAVNGTVYSESGEPLAGRTVELRPLSAQRSYNTTTNPQGQYKFPVVESPADYRLTVFGGANFKDYQQHLQLTVDTDEQDIVVEAYEFGTVTGQLVNQNGVPVADFDLALRNGRSSKPNALVSTDRFGNFEITSAPAGKFVLASQSTPSILVQGLQLNSGTKLHLPLVLDLGEHAIHGTVLNAHDNPVPASRVILRWSNQTGGMTTSAIRRTAADTQGYFTFSNLGPGPHSLQVIAPGYSPVNIDHDLIRQGYDLTVRLN